MKKKTIILGSILLVLAMVTGIFCTNLFGSRDLICNFGNRILWKLDRESVSVQNMIHAVIDTNANSKLEQLEKIVFPKEAYIDKYDASASVDEEWQEKADFREIDDYLLSYDFLVVFPKEETKQFVEALRRSGFIEYIKKEDKFVNIPQTLGSFSPEQLSYAFKLEYPSKSKFPDVYIRGPQLICIYIFEDSENTKVIIDS